MIDVIEVSTRPCRDLFKGAVVQTLKNYKAIWFSQDVNMVVSECHVYTGTITGNMSVSQMLIVADQHKQTC